MARLAAVSSAHWVVYLRSMSVWTGGVNETCRIDKRRMDNTMMSVKIDRPATYMCIMMRQNAGRPGQDFCTYMQCSFRIPDEHVQWYYLSRCT